MHSYIIPSFLILFFVLDILYTKDNKDYSMSVFGVFAIISYLVHLKFVLRITYSFTDSLEIFYTRPILKPFSCPDFNRL